VTSKVLFLSDPLKGLVPLSGRDDPELVRVVDLLTKEAKDGVEEIVLRLTDALKISEDAALSLYRSLNYIAGEGSDASLEANALLDEVERAIERSSLEDGEKAGLATLFKTRPKPLRDLLDPYSRWRAVQKKQDLIGGVVNSVEGVRTICDLRPIFDEKRETIVDTGVTVTIEFLVINREGHAQQVVVSSSPSVLDTIVRKLTTAQKKVATIEATFGKGVVRA
jgi:hypothetical protein